MEKIARKLRPSMVAAGVAVLSWASLSVPPAAADVYRYVETSLQTILAGIVGAPERQPRDLTINGAPLEFTPYQSSRSVADITDEWLKALAADTRLAPVPADPVAAQLARAANDLVTPKVSRVGDDFSVIVRFFDGDGPAALAFLDRNVALTPAELASRPTPGMAVSVRRPPGSQTTEVLMSRFEDAAASLAAFAADADPRRLPATLRPPAGVTVLSDIGDRGAGHMTRTVVSSGRVSAAAWRDTRARLLAGGGFSVERVPPGRNGLLALHGRRGAVEADVLYASGANAGEIVEVIAIRQLLLEGKAP